MVVVNFQGRHLVLHSRFEHLIGALLCSLNMGVNDETLCLIASALPAVLADTHRRRDAAHWASKENKTLKELAMEDDAAPAEEYQTVMYYSHPQGLPPTAAAWEIRQIHRISVRSVDPQSREMSKRVLSSLDTIQSHLSARSNGGTEASSEACVRAMAELGTHAPPHIIGAVKVLSTLSGAEQESQLATVKSMFTSYINNTNAAATSEPSSAAIGEIQVTDTNYGFCSRDASSV